MSRTDAIDYFSRELRQAMGSSLARLILYGSVATGEAGERSDIDIVAVHFGGAKDALDRVAEIGFETALRYGQLVECIPISAHEFRAGANRSFFLREVGRGRVLFEMDEKDAVRQEAGEYSGLAEEYRSYARSALERGECRPAVDIG